MSNRSHHPVPVAPRPARRGDPVRLLAAAHLGVLGVAERGRRALARDRGQGTVEYVALAMLIAALMAGVVIVASKSNGGGIAEAVTKKVKEAIDGAGKK